MTLKADSDEFNIDESKLDELAVTVKDWCLVNGIIALTKKSESDKCQSHDSAYPLPVTLLPTKFPSKEFNFALNLQNSFNDMIYRIANDLEFLHEKLKNVVKVDDFTRRLINICNKVNDEGISQPISMGIFRNDFMLDSNKNDKLTQLSQIEINTISCSFGAATSQISKLHRYLLNYTNNQKFVAKQPENQNASFMAKGLVEGWKCYGNPEAVIVFIVTAEERNIGDQRLLEYKILQLEPKIKICRYTLSEIFSQGELDSQKNLIVKNEVALVYYRAGYDPKDYQNENDWDARLLIERSKAIKCPTIQIHLVGSKKIQQVLYEPDTVERFVKDKEVCEKIRATFVDQYSFEDNNVDNVIEFMLKNCEEFVLKPQREGGGNNIYKSDIKKFYESLKDKSELMSYILMRLVKPYVNQNYLIKSNSSIFKGKLISELGIYGILIASPNKIIMNETGGYLLRTKSIEVNEGGVATGYSALDSVYLV